MPGKSDRDTERANRRKLNAGLESLEMGDTLFIQNKTYHVMGGVYAENLFNVTLQIEGTLEWSQHTSYWPKNEDGKVQPCLYFDRCSRLSITAKGVKVREHVTLHGRKLRITYITVHSFVYVHAPP